MIKKKYRYFFAFKKRQENWLNNEAKKGYRLIGVGKLVYEFEKCEPGKYKYYIEFVADKTYSELKRYEEDLKEQGIKYFTKNINLSYSLGKLRWRPFIKGPAQIVTSPGNYNKELLIIEKKADEKFELNTKI